MKKPTRWLTNSPWLAEGLERHCPGTHTHEHLLGGRAKGAQVYPPQLCKAIVAAFSKQLTLDLSDVGMEALDARTKTEAQVFLLEILEDDPEDPKSAELNTNEHDSSDWVAEDDV